MTDELSVTATVEQQIGEALNYFLPRRPKVLRRTTILKVHKPTIDRVVELLWAHEQTTNLRAHVLARLGPHHAIACVHEMLRIKAAGSKENVTSLLGEIIDACFRKSRNKQIRFTPPFRDPVSVAEFPIPRSLRVGVYHKVALDVLLWYQRVTINEDEDLEDRTNTDVQVVGEEASAEETGSEQEDILIPSSLVESIPDTDELFNLWAEQIQHYAEKSKTVVPFGPDKGKMLNEIEVKGVRWLEQRLVPLNVVAETLAAIHILQHSNMYKDEVVSSAKNLRHPFRRSTSLEQRPQANRLAQRFHEKDTPNIKLGALNDKEFGWLENIMLEHQEYGVQYAAIREAVDVFLHQKPPSFPTVAKILSEAEREAAKATHYTDLDRTRDPFPRGDQPPEEVSAEQLLRVDINTSHRIQQSGSKLREQKLQPLKYPKLMRPPYFKPSFALLYRLFEPNDVRLHRRYHYLTASKREALIKRLRERGPSYQYVLAVVVHDEIARTEPHTRKCFAPSLDLGDYFYVDFPATPFLPPKDVSLIVLPLECGWQKSEERSSQSDRLLQEHIARQAIVQAGIKLKLNENADTPTPMPACMPKKAAMGAIEIVVKRNERGHYEFFVHLPVPVPVPPCEELPTTIIGFHEHNDGYSYAVIGIDGQVAVTGDVAIPDHIDMRPGETHYRPGYANEVALAMVRLAKQHKAYIAVEETSWKKRQPSLKSSYNQQTFLKPTAKIAQVLRTKALYAGLLTPREVSGVNSRLCGSCGTEHSLPPLRAISAEQLSCPICGVLCPDSLDEVGVNECQECGTVWDLKDKVFTCQDCGRQNVSKYNRALVTAKLAALQIVTHHQHSLANEGKYKKKRSPKRGNKKSARRKSTS